MSGDPTAATADAPLHDAPGATVEVRGFHLLAGGQPLLTDAEARFLPGQVTLIVGPSGAGKSLFLRFLAGLIEPDDPDVEAHGEVHIDGRPAPPLPRRPVGVVFQSFALFDELTPTENVAFAQAHRRRNGAAHGPAARPRDLLDELRVPRQVRTASLSGGQRQRLAIARTLAYGPEVLLYDEPTSGLDAVTAGRVADLIADTHRRHPQTSIIVTHDYESLARIADRLYLLDPPSKSLREIPRADWDRLPEYLASAGAPEIDPGGTDAATAAHPPSAPPVAAELASEAAQESPPPDVPAAKPRGEREALPSRLVRGFAEYLVGTSRASESILSIPWRLLPLWRSPGWGLRFLGHYLRLVAGPTAWIYIAIAGAIAGFVSTYFTFRYLPYRSHMEPLFLENLLGAIGFSQYRVLAPLLVTILVAARSGAAVASDVGGKAYGRQMDALRTFGAPPGRYLGTGILYAFLLGTPLLVAIGYVSACLTSLVVFTGTHAEGPFVWEENFHRDLVQQGVWWFRGTGWLLAKVLVCAAGTGTITWHRASRPMHSPSDVSHGVTSTILWSTLWVLVTHFAFAFYEFEGLQRGIGE